MTAARMFSEIAEHFQINLSLTTLYRAPTIETLANKLEEKIKTTQNGVKENFLVEIQPAGENRPSIILVPHLFGDAFVFRDIVNNIPNDIGIYSVHSSQEENLKNLTVDEIINNHLPQVLNTQIESPYFIGGNSFGGVLAYHLAYRLQRMNKKLGFVSEAMTLSVLASTTTA